MNFIKFQHSNDALEIAILIKEAQFNINLLKQHYVNDMINLGLNIEQIIAWDLPYNSNNKAPIAMQKTYLNKLLNGLSKQGINTLYVCDANYFKTLTKTKKAEPNIGYVLPCAIKGYESMNVVLGINYAALLYTPEKKTKLQLSIKTLVQHSIGVVIPMGSNIIHSAQYYDDVTHTNKQIKEMLNTLHQYPALTIDIEAFSLMFNKAGIATIAFAWDEHNGIAIACDYSSNRDQKIIMTSGYGYFFKNLAIRKLLKQFFTSYKGKLIYHNANYDIKVLIYTLWMNDPLDQKGLLQGLSLMTKRIEDTKLIAFLATNSTTGNNLQLKELAHEYAGNYAEDVKNITLIKKTALLKYNLIDCLSTWYVYKKYKPILIQDLQLNVYDNIFIPSVKVLLQMELSGAPLDMKEVIKTEKKLVKERNNQIHILKTSAIIQQYEIILRKQEWTKKNLLLKVKVKPLSDFDNITFNPNSSKQVAGLLYDYLNYDVIDTTDTNLPATGAKTLAKLLLVVKNTAHEEILNALIRLAKVTIIINTFITSFTEKSIEKSDNRWYLHGNFNLGGTVSGRMSSSKPNMQNIPSTGSEYAKDIKRCFKAPSGWLIVGADFSSLEDRISALTTKDPNKMAVYIGHTVYELMIDGTCHHIRDDAIISHGNTTYTGEEFYEKFKSNS